MCHLLGHKFRYTLVTARDYMLGSMKLQYVIDIMVCSGIGTIWGKTTLQKLKSLMLDNCIKLPTFRTNFRTNCNKMCASICTVQFNNHVLVNKVLCITSRYFYVCGSGRLFCSVLRFFFFFFAMNCSNFPLFSSCLNFSASSNFFFSAAREQ